MKQLFLFKPFDLSANSITSPLSPKSLSQHFPSSVCHHVGVKKVPKGVVQLRALLECANAVYVQKHQTIEARGARVAGSAMVECKPQKFGKCCAMPLHPASLSPVQEM